jgi:predicted transcriptional regulator
VKKLLNTGEKMEVKDIMKKDLITIGSDAKISEE